MAASFNKVILLSNLTREPELRYTPGGVAVCEFGLAINRRFVSNNQEREESCFVEIVVWGKIGENCGRFLSKGAQVMVDGRLQYDQWEDRDTGTRRNRLRVVAEQVQFLNTRRNDVPMDADGGADYSTPPQQTPARSQYGRSNGAAPGQGQGNYPNRAGAPPQQGSRSYGNPPPMPPLPEDAFGSGTGGDIDDDIPF